MDNQPSDTEHNAEHLRRPPRDIPKKAAEPDAGKPREAPRQSDGQDPAFG